MLSNGLDNVRITGFLSEKEKLLYLGASDVAINPMSSGSGTNIKMFDFMAAGLPVISTGIGSRGITNIDYAGILIRDRSDIQSSLQDLMDDDQKAQNLGNDNRELVERNYLWERISPQLGSFINNIIARKIIGVNQVMTRGGNKKFALMSSWNLRCGIAEHSRHLANEFEDMNLDFRIIANSNGDLANSYLIEDISRNIYPLWKYDYLNWKDTTIDIAGILHTMRCEEISKFNLQYHIGFFNQQMMKVLVRACIDEEIEISITLHNAREMDIETLSELSQLGLKMFVHNSEEETWMKDQGIHNVFHIPLGVLNFPDEEKNDCRNKYGISGNPVIGSFGYLRPHKGIIEAIEAISLLKNHYPNIKFLGVNALYPSEDSEKYLRNCHKRIDELELNENVTLFTSFLEMKHIIHYLHACDVIVLHYHDSKEGSSAAANTAISARRPLIISKSGIFNEIKNVGYILENIDPPSIAAEIQSLLSKPKVLAKMKTKVVNYMNENSYMKSAEKYVELIIGDK